MNATLLYDGTFEGFLSAVFHSFERKIPHALIIREEKSTSGFFEKYHSITTCETQADRVWTGFRKKVGSRTPFNFYSAFLSELDGMENCLLHFMQYVFSNGKAADGNFANADVLKVGKVAKMVQREKHRMEAFVRFRLTIDNIYYAVIEPDFNVIPLIKKHFTSRYADQKWIIYDLKRKYGLFYDLEKTEIVEIDFDDDMQKAQLPDHSIEVNEKLFQQLWQSYFKSVNIPARKNLKLHLRHVPVRYWKYLTEKNY
jgi:probable DNA metabolism protein